MFYYNITIAIVNIENRIIIIIIIYFIFFVQYLQVMATNTLNFNLLLFHLFEQKFKSPSFKLHNTVYVYMPHPVSESNNFRRSRA